MNADSFSDGIRMLIVGLAKKVIFANNFALVADSVFDAGESFGGLIFWVGAIAYSLQILFDFSGYSDMAIGLGKMFGFEFDINFNYPYISKSVTDFWRRWHISLGSWFRDYVYIPLGGNRVSKGRHILNLFVVWALTGLWHGANWTFVVWGLMYFLLLVFEKNSHLDKVFEKKLHFLPHVYTLFMVMLGWIIFRSDSIGKAASYIKHMFSKPLSGSGDLAYLRMYAGEYGIIFLLSLFFIIPVKEKLKGKYEKAYWTIAVDLIYAILFLWSICYIVKGSYNPFIYFNF